MPSTWLHRASAWLIAASVALLLLGQVGASADLAAFAALAIAAVVAWSLLRPSADRRYDAGRRLLVAANAAGPMRSSDPDAPGRPRPRAPGA
jgi:hypothetical protein